jgi:HK97 family phage portal protein
VATQQFGPGVLLDATGNPFSSAALVGQSYTQAAPPGAYLPAPYGPTTIVVYGGSGQLELTDEDALPRTISYADIYASQPSVAAVVGKMVRRMSCLPLKVWKHAPGDRTVSMPKVGTKPARTRKALPEEICDPSDSLWSLVNRPAPGYGSVSLREWQMLSVLVHGNSLLAKYRGNGMDEEPTELIPLDWRFIQGWARIGNPVIVWGTVQTGILKAIMPSETIFTAWGTVAGPNGHWIGTSPLSQLGTTIRVDEAAQRFASMSFQNAARPSAVITIPAEVSPREVEPLLDRIQEEVQESYGGVGNAFKAMVMGGGADVKPWGATSAEAQLVETRTYDAVEVCAVYDMGFAGLFSQQAKTPEDEALAWKDLRPWTRLADDRLNAQLVEPEPAWSGYFLKTDFDEVLYGDPLVLSDKMVAEVEAGIRSVNEGRLPLGLDPRDDPAADELIYRVPSAGLVGDMPGSASVAEEEREMVMPPPGMNQPLEKLDTTLGSNEGG